ncbi:hypothetical protein HY772_03115 [Candidatus Woesearchaeota archaeon]|nr:hypothetical protein [Candidatus Woesearchaeota archaeon]
MTSTKPPIADKDEEAAYCAFAAKNALRENGIRQSTAPSFPFTQRRDTKDCVEIQMAIAEEAIADERHAGGESEFAFTSIASTYGGAETADEADEDYIPISVQPMSLDAAVVETLKGLRVLVGVRDYKARAETAAKLRSYGCEVQEAEYDAQLYGAVSSGFFSDVAILDWTMMNAAEYCKKRDAFVVGVQAPRYDERSIDYLFSTPSMRNPCQWDDTPHVLVGNLQGLENYLTSRVFIADYEPIRKKREDTARAAQNIFSVHLHFSRPAPLRRASRVFAQPTPREAQGAILTS